MHKAYYQQDIHRCYANKVAVVTKSGKPRKEKTIVPIGTKVFYKEPHEGDWGTDVFAGKTTSRFPDWASSLLALGITGEIVSIPAPRIPVYGVYFASIHQTLGMKRNEFETL